jgi:hypothetical protein
MVGRTSTQRRVLGAQVWHGARPAPAVPLASRTGNSWIHNETGSAKNCTHPTRTRVVYDGVSGATLESAGDAAEILRRKAAECADLARRLEDLTATRSEAPLLVVRLGPRSGLTILYSS